MNKIFNQKIQKEKRRALRKRSTRSEHMLWQNLRNRGIDGFKFRRQFSVGPFVLDFYCPELKLAIEVDGYSHDSEEAKKYDAERQEIIETYGVVFVRIRDEEVKENIELAIIKIKDQVKKLNPTSPFSLPLK
ncbi:endonuclease domain-containing protein [bacterium]|nr:MAG: endonuclease domain-containing protein [bacterium]